MPEAKFSRRQVIAAVSILVLLVALLFVPKFRSEYELLNYTRFLILALMAQGWNLIGGYTGYAAFGNVAFFGIGAYTTGLLMISKWAVPFFPAMFCGAILAALVAVVIGLPVLRLKGHYFAIATLGVAEATREIADTWTASPRGPPGSIFRCAAKASSSTTARSRWWSWA